MNHPETQARRRRLLALLASDTPRPVGPLKERILQRLTARIPEAPRGAWSSVDTVLPSGVLVERNLAYGSDPAMRVDVFRPATALGAPLILFVHGGGWRRGDKGMPQMTRHKMPHWTRQGCIFVSANYRLLPDADVLGQADDVARALRFVQAEATHWGGDPDRVVLVGHSAGAHLVCLLTADAQRVSRLGVRRWLATVALDSAALDMVAVMNRPHYRFYDPVFGTDPAYWHEASPTHRLQAEPAAPMLLVCAAGRDDAASAAQTFAARARGFGGRVEVLPVALDHLQLNDQLGLQPDYTAAVDDFLRSVGAA